MARWKKGQSERKAARAVKKKLTREQKKAGRTKHGPLKNNIVSWETVTRYQFAMKLTLRWMLLQFNGVWPTNYGALDEAVSGFIESLWQEGEPRCLAEQVVAATQYYIKKQPWQIERLLVAVLNLEKTGTTEPFTTVERGFDACGGGLPVVAWMGALWHGRVVGL